MFSKLLLIVAGLVFGLPAFSQTPVFYCVKDGKRVITDQPCENFGAIQEKKLEGRERLPAKSDPVTDEIVRSMVCPSLQNQRQAILDDQYYRGIPASPARLNRVDAMLLERGCVRKDVIER